jgi:hypothetical protein
MKKSMPSGAVVVVALLLFSYTSATAEYYKYRDAEGHIRYTDNWADVPEDQRPATETFEGVSDNAPSQTPAIDDNSSAGNNVEENDDSEKDDQAVPVVDEETIKELNQRKKELDKEFSDLMEEKYNLLKEKEKLANSLAGRDTAAVAEYDKKVEALNRKIADYQKRRDAFQEEAEAVKKAVENPGS